MQNLVYLMVILVAGGAGWYGGSWKGRDAIQAVARYQQLGEAAQAELQQARARLQAELAAKDARFDAELRQLGQAHAEQVRSYDATMAGNAREIARLTQLGAAGQARIASLLHQRDAAATPDARHRLEQQVRTEIAAQQAVQAEIDGRQCLPVPVPPAVLADWQPVQTAGRP